MYQFTTTNVINTAKVVDMNGIVLKDATGTDVPKYAGTSTVFNVAKVGAFKKAGIVLATKRPYSAAVLETATLTVPSGTTGHVLKTTIEVRLSQSTQSEYTNYSLDFKKPVTVEIISAGNTTTDATAITAQLKGLKDRFGYTLFTATSSGAVITIVAKDPTQRFSAITLSDVIVNSTSLTQYDDFWLASGVVTVPGVQGFGDDIWMQRSIMLPTLENTRFFGVSKDERPILGGQYSEYVLRYSIDKDGQDGTVSGGKSITTHIFYVISAQAVAFEAALNTTLGSTGVLVTIGGDQDLIIVGDQTVAASAGATTYTVLNAAAGETVNWTNTVLAGTTSANTTGVLTVGATTGTTTLTATGATSGRVATFVVNVV